MHKEQRRVTRLRVGDWVVLGWAWLKLAQVVEDRGPLGVGGRRILRIRIDVPELEPQFTEAPEEELELATEADRANWQAHGSLATYYTVAYRGHERDRRGDPTPVYHYALIARHAPEDGPATAMIVPLHVPEPDEAKRHTVSVERGGPLAAFGKAEEYLDALPEHRGLTKSRTHRRPRAPELAGNGPAASPRRAAGG